jgi:hypothetical protein
MEGFYAMSGMEPQHSRGPTKNDLPKNKGQRKDASLPKKQFREERLI